ncbi:receptor-like protein 12 isoform X2 [Amborella trichopoda]|uniref:receptor-like protein 12 isoform X2 n=1 Tax=Amborella trichopoda TaxID=13333 RepID=UPI0009BCBC9E|nr:receptor-like protein 12 isoform X2 [Amborella trichopoda]|eukprot:XP_020519254.1 receptor-like protein 12 isoform X2 [Amborella trichopoda]
MEAKKGALLPHPLRLISLLSFTAVMCFFDFSMALEGSPFCRENERVALLDFKASHSTNATLMDSWKGLNCCEWEGVKCHSSSSHVVSLRVYRIPWNITGYTNSVMLNASSLTRLGQLQHLGLSSFAGVLPIKELSKLKNLRELILDFNEFSGGIPEEVGLLSSLQVLYLNGNRLQGRIPSTLGNLSLLNSLQLYENQLSGSIPESLGSLLSLEWLGLGNNKLEGSIPSTLGNLSLLNELLLYGNQLSGSIPESLGSLLSLKRLDLGENKLEGSIPCELDTTQFCTFNESSFSGNPNLNTQGKRCSTTLSSNVPTGPSDDDGEDEDEGEEGWVEMTPAVYAFIALGYAIGIWGALAFLFFGNKRGHACVRAMDAIVSRLFRAFCRKH